MLAEAARFARLIGAVADRAYLERWAKAALTTTVAWIAALVLAFIAKVFVLIAVFAALIQEMPIWAAALVVAAIAIVLAGIAVLVATRPSRRVPLPRNPAVDPLAFDANAITAAAMAPLVDEALRATREKPGETMLLAVAAGLIAGRWLRRPRR